MISKMAYNMVRENQRGIEKNARLEKDANFIVGHLLQNLFGRVSMSYPKALGTEKMFLRNIAKPDEGMSTLAGNAIYGVGKGLVPELGIMNEQFSHLGKSLQKNLAEKGMSLSDLSNRDIVVLRRALAGDFAKALESNSPLANELVGSVVGAYNPQLKTLFDKGILTPNMIRRKAARQAKNLGKDGISNLRSQLPVDESQLPITPEQAQKLLEGFGKTWKENRLTSNLADAINTRASERYGPELLPRWMRLHKKGLAKKLREAEKGEDTMLRKGLRGAGDLAGNALLASVDRSTFGLNMVKRFADAKKVRDYKAGKVMQDNLQDLFMTQPIQNSFGKGIKGDYVQPLRINKARGEYNEAKKSGTRGKLLKNYTLETLDSQVMNPFTATTKHIANGFGKAVHDAGITPAQLAEFAAKNGEKYPVMKQFPAEPKTLSKAYDGTINAAVNSANFAGEAARNSWQSFKEGIKNIPDLLREIRIG